MGFWKCDQTQVGFLLLGRVLVVERLKWLFLIFSLSFSLPISLLFILLRFAILLELTKNWGKALYVKKKTRLWDESERREKAKVLRTSVVQSVLELYYIRTCMAYVLRSFGREVRTGLRLALNTCRTRSVRVIQSCEYSCHAASLATLEKNAGRQVGQPPDRKAWTGWIFLSQNTF